MYIFKEENLNTHWGVFKMLGEMAYIEVEETKLEEILTPDKELYLLLNETNSIRYYEVVYEHEIVGFASFFVNPSLHHRGKFNAVSDVVYVKPEHRGCGMDFINYIKDELKNEGVDMFSITFKTKHTSDKVVKKCNLSFPETTYHCVLNT